MVQTAKYGRMNGKAFRHITGSLMAWLFLTSFVTGTNEVSQMRQLYSQASQREQSAKKLIKIASAKAEENVLYKGYKGAATVIMANHASYPLGKWQYFNEGKDILESAIQNDPDHVELRYIRLTIQANAPAFLGYNTMVKTDKAFLRSRLDKIKDEELKKMIGDFLKTN